jgi:type II secretory pathway component PulF
MKTNSYSLIVVFAIVLGLIILVIPELRKTYSQTNETNVIPNAESVFQSDQ